MSHANVQADLTTNDKSLRDGLSRGEAAVQQYAQKFNTQLDSIAKRYLTIGGIATAAMGYITSAQAQSTIATAKAADRLGMSAQAFQAYAYAAKRAGLENEAFGAMLGKFQARIGAAVAGAADAKQGFEGLGLSVASMAQAAPEDAFRSTIEALSKIPNESDRALAAVRIFGEEGLKLMLLINQGSGGLDAATARLKKLGNAINAGDAKRLQEAADTMDDLRQSLGKFAESAAVAMAPQVKAISEALTSLVASYNNLSPAAKAAATTVAEIIVVGGAAVLAISKMTQAVQTFTKIQVVAQAFSGPKGWATLAASAAVVAGGMYAMNKAMAEAGAVTSDATKGAEAQSAAEKRRASAIQATTAALSAQKAEQEKLNKAAKDRAEALEAPTVGFWRELEKTHDAYQKLGNQAQADRVAELRKKFFDIDPSTSEQFRSRMSQLNAALNDGAITWAQYADAVQAARQKAFGENVLSPMEKFQEAMQRNNEALRENAIGAEQWAERRKKALDEAFGAVDKSPVEKFREMVQALNEARGAGGGGASAGPGETGRQETEQQRGPRESRRRVSEAMERAAKAAEGVADELTTEQQGAARDRVAGAMRRAQGGGGSDLSTEPQGAAARQRVQDALNRAGGTGAGAGVAGNGISEQEYRDRLAQAAKAAFGEAEKSPLQKYRETEAQMREAVRAGGISPEEARRRMDAAAKQYQQDTGFTAAFDATRSKAEQAATRIRELQGMRDRREIDPETYARAMRQAYQANAPDGGAGLYNARVQEAQKALRGGEFGRGRDAIARYQDAVRRAFEDAMPEENRQALQARLTRLREGLEGGEFGRGRRGQEAYQRQVQAAYREYGPQPRERFQMQFRSLEDQYKQMAAAAGSDPVADNTRRAADFLREIRDQLRRPQAPGPRPQQVLG